VKQLENNFRTFFLCVLLFFLSQDKTDAQTAHDMDSIEIGLITCSPHEEIYSLYGHSALRYHNLRTKQDIAFNWGVFNYKAPHFVLRFVFGLTDYELGIFPFRGFIEYYRQWGSEVDEQVLNLTPEEKRRITDALAVNLRPENIIYRYNFFYDNCSTRPRNIIEDNIDGEIIYAPRPDYHPSFREMIHEKNAHHPWSAFGNDLLLGCKADCETTLRDQEFLPANLMFDFDHAVIKSNGQTRPLVKERRIIVPAGKQVVKKEFPLSPFQCALLLGGLFLAVFIWEYKHKKCLPAFDAVVMAGLGITGCIIFIMLFSQHPTTSTNLQILLFNPVHLFFIPSVLRRKTPNRYWTFLLTLVCLFLIGSWFQTYASGTIILALCLLSRYWSHLKYES